MDRKGVREDAAMSAAAARALVAQTNAATLATVGADGAPWASLVAFGVLPDGAPVLSVSHLAEHGRNLARDPRASLVVCGPVPGGDPLEAERVTLTGAVWRPSGDGAAAARAAYLAAAPGAATSIDFADFTLYVLDVQRVRWVGGRGRMETVAAVAYAAARAV
jgi:putative heme iron utilization protein